MIRALSLFAFAAVVFSCSEGPAYEAYQSLDSQPWQQKKAAKFEVEIQDTSALYDVNIHLRHNNSYPYRNLYSFITVVFPNQKTLRDTLNIWLSDPAGRWYGTGIGSVKSIGTPFLEGIQFPLKGKYIFEVEQGMREDELTGIEDVGIEVRLSK